MIRVVAHVDLDCFYCQVEHKRLGIPPTVPLAVQQWNMVIAVNYAARAKPFQIKRGMSARECKKRCPNIELVHVEVVDANSKYGSDSVQEDDNKSRGRRQEVSKASLERYRRASEEIMVIFSRFIPLCERASIDEAYFDLTDIAAARDLRNDIDFDTIDSESVLNTIPPYKLSIESSRIERRYAVGAVIVSEIRNAVFQELGYTVSAGIAGNKMIAKQASAAFKPNRQTIVPPAASLAMISGLKIRDVRGLGGKMGVHVSSKLQVSTLGEIRTNYTLAELNTLLGSKNGGWLHNLCLGNDEEPVKANLVPKSLLAFKSFEIIDTTQEVERWLQLLCNDVLNRMKGDMIANTRKAKTITVWHKYGGTGGLESTRSGPLPTVVSSGGTRQLLDENTLEENLAIASSLLPTLTDLVQTCLQLLGRLPCSMIPCSRLGVGVSDFVPQPHLRPGGGHNNKTVGALDRFFVNSKATPSAANGTSSSAGAGTDADLAAGSDAGGDDASDSNNDDHSHRAPDIFEVEDDDDEDSRFEIGESIASHSNSTQQSTTSVPFASANGNSKCSGFPRAFLSSLNTSSSSKPMQTTSTSSSSSSSSSSSIFNTLSCPTSANHDDDHCNNVDDDFDGADSREYNNNDIAISSKCPKCGCELPLDDLERQSHFDEHLAQELNDEWNHTQPSNASLKSGAATAGKRKLEPIQQQSRKGGAQQRQSPSKKSASKQTSTSTVKSATLDNFFVKRAK